MQLMLYLGQNYNKGYISLKEIALNCGLSSNYLAQIILLLKKEGLINSKEGKGGGHCLSKNPKDIKVLDILESLEGKMALVKCYCDNKQSACYVTGCKTKKIWGKFLLDIKKYFNNITLDDVLKLY